MPTFLSIFKNPGLQGRKCHVIQQPILSGEDGGANMAKGETVSSSKILFGIFRANENWKKNKIFRISL